MKGHSKEHPGYYLHTGGTGILTWEDAENKRLGEHSDKEYNDWTRVEDLTNLPDTAFHRNVDKIVLEAGEKHSDVLKTVIVCPPTIYGALYYGSFVSLRLLTVVLGRGRGPVSVRSRQVYELTKLILTGKYIPVVGSGKARWNSVHVSDLAQLFRLLVEAGVKGNSDKELWGARGYLLAENGEHVWTELAERIGKEAERLGFVGTLEKRDLSYDAALQQAGFEAISWGLNSRGKAERARKVLGWAPSAPSIEEEVPSIIKDEHERLEGGFTSPAFRAGVK